MAGSSQVDSHGRKQSGGQSWQEAVKWTVMAGSSQVDSHGRKPFFTDSSLGRKQEIAASLAEAK